MCSTVAKMTVVLGLIARTAGGKWTCGSSIVYYNCRKNITLQTNLGLVKILGSGKGGVAGKLGRNLREENVSKATVCLLTDLEGKLVARVAGQEDRRQPGRLAGNLSTGG